MNKKSTSR